jgi:hypothetical protein
MVHRVPVWLLCVLCFGLAVAALAQEMAPAAPPAALPAESAKPLQIEADRPIVPYQVFGSLTRVNGGQVSPWDLFPVDTSRWIAGLGTGTAGRHAAVGDTLTLAGRTFVRSTDPKMGVKVIELTKPYQGAFALAMVKPEGIHNVFPRVYRVENTEPALLHTVLENLAKDAGTAIGIIGWTDMPEVEGIALKRAPIEDQSLTGSQKDAYLDTIRAKDANIAFFAVVVPAVLPRPSLNSVLIARHSMDYDVAQGQPSAALIHVHAALIDKAVPADYTTAPLILDGLRTVGVKDICHLYGFSTVKRGVFLVYRLDYLQDKTY